MNTQETNNILSLSTCSQRFSLLPIATNLSLKSSSHSTSSKINMIKSNVLQQYENNHQIDVNVGNESGLATFRPLTTNVAEVATYYSKWFQNIVK